MPAKIRFIEFAAALAIGIPVPAVPFALASRGERSALALKRKGLGRCIRQPVIPGSRVNHDRRDWVLRAIGPAQEIASHHRQAAACHDILLTRARLLQDTKLVTYNGECIMRWVTLSMWTKKSQGGACSHRHSQTISEPSRLSFFAALRISRARQYVVRHMRILRCAQNDRRDGSGQACKYSRKKCLT